MTHFIVQYRGKAIGFYQHEEMARSVAVGFGARGSVVEAEGAVPTNAELDGLGEVYEIRPRVESVKSVSGMHKAV